MSGLRLFLQQIEHTSPDIEGWACSKGFWYSREKIWDQCKGFGWKTEIILRNLVSNETPRCVVIPAPLVSHLPGPFDLKLSVVYEDKARFVEEPQRVLGELGFLFWKVPCPIERRYRFILVISNEAV